MNVATLVESVSKAIGNLVITASDEVVGFAKGNITDHVTTLLSTPRNRSVVEAVNFLADYVKLPLAAADAAERCASSALANLTRIDGLASKNPLDYVPSTCKEIKHCLYEQAAKKNIKLGWFLTMVIVVIVMTVLFGPSWPILVPLRVLGFGAAGVMPVHIAPMLQSVLYGGHTPAGGWFATFTGLGMTVRRGRL